MLEKQAVEDGCAGISSLRAIDSAESLEIAVRACYFAASLVGNDPLDVASVDPTQSFAYCLSKVFERPLWQSTASYQFLHEFSGFFLHMDKWFQSRHNDDNLYLRGLSPTIHKVTFMNPTTSFSRPFVIREDSIFKQFRSRTVATNMNTKDKQVDPMRYARRVHLTAIMFANTNYAEYYVFSNSMELAMTRTVLISIKKILKKLPKQQHLKMTARTK